MDEKFRREIIEKTKKYDNLTVKEMFALHRGAGERTFTKIGDIVKRANLILDKDKNEKWILCRGCGEYYNKLYKYGRCYFCIKKAEKEQSIKDEKEQKGKDSLLKKVEKKRADIDG